MIKAKKSLGQNFLIDRDVLEKITKVKSIKNKNILEIGPGTGNLTSFILKNNPKKFFVIEKDNVLAKNLENLFKDKLTIINNDILKIDETSLYHEKFIVYGNLPYNISTEILIKWITNLKENFWFEHLILLFQKEVADRIIANFNTSAYGRISILANWKLSIEKICDVRPESFSPKPKINSTLLLFTPKKIFYKIKESKNLEEITKVFFNHRRKMLKKPFNQLFKGNENILNKLNINLNLRPQNLNFDTYYLLAKEYEDLNG